MNLKQRTHAFIELGSFLNRHIEKKYKPEETKFHDDLTTLTETIHIYNGWFTKDNVSKALQGIAYMLNYDEIIDFSKTLKEPTISKTVAIIAAGNIPAVGFHDIMCVLLSGHSVLIKLSSDDHALIPFLLGILMRYESGFTEKIQFATGKLENFDAVIATGSNNSARYFEQYFEKYPHIIRKNRTSIAILTGNETQEELMLLGNDIFQYYGLGCRNVSKLFVPENYSLDGFFEAIFSFKDVVDNKKYGNNYDYNRAIYLLDGITFLDNNFLMLKEDKGNHPPTSVLFYEYYSSIDELLPNIVSNNKDMIQCIVANPAQNTALKTVNFGQTQYPKITDFADDINTLEFLNTLS